MKQLEFSGGSFNLYVNNAYRRGPRKRPNMAIRAFNRFLGKFGSEMDGDQHGLNIRSYNIIRGNQTGLNLAPFPNAVRGDQIGVNISLFEGNIIGGNQIGVNCGLANFADERQIGLNVGGVANGAYGLQAGVNASVIMNIVRSGHQIGLNIAGIWNDVARSVGDKEIYDQKGLNASLLNTVDGNSTGVTFSAVNVVSNLLKGISAGFLTYARKMAGLVIGAVTIVKDSKESRGLQIGLVNLRLDQERWYDKVRPFFAYNTPDSPTQIR